jgi:hypothetical protein
MKKKKRTFFSAAFEKYLSTACSPLQIETRGRQ